MGISEFCEKASCSCRRIDGYELVRREARLSEGLAVPLDEMECRDKRGRIRSAACRTTLAMTWGCLVGRVVRLRTAGARGTRRPQPIQTYTAPFVATPPERAPNDPGPRLRPALGVTSSPSLTTRTCIGEEPLQRTVSGELVVSGLFFGAIPVGIPPSTPIARLGTKWVPPILRSVVYGPPSFACRKMGRSLPCRGR